MTSFSDFQLLPSLLGTLKEKNLSKPTEIQASTVPALLDGRSLVGVAQTGSGKTLAYALPLLHKLKILENQGEAVREERQPRALVLVPTRELGEQVARVFKLFTHDTRLRVRSVLGGTTLEVAKKNILGTFEILIATPGRLVQMMDRDLIQLGDVRMVVFDEVDQMLDPSFLPDADLIVAACPPERQMALFSATVSPAVQELMENLFSTAEIIRSADSARLAPSLTTQNRIVTDGKRWPVLEKVLAEPTEGGTLVFTNTREQCDKLASELSQKGYLCAIYRGEMDKGERRSNLKKFREGKIDLLISTDLASRGLDIEHIGRVINYHLPQQLENYIHRVGRTARAGRKGVVVNFVTERDQRLMEQLEKRQPGTGVKAPAKKSSAGNKSSGTKKFRSQGFKKKSGSSNHKRKSK